LHKKAAFFIFKQLNVVQNMVTNYSNKPKVVVLTGAGISAESGIKTFRDSDGLWENYDVYEVASIEGYRKNPELVNQFYNDRRGQLASVEPNAAHKALVKLEMYFDTQIITQNVDDLHERAGSSKVLHLHGELTKLCSTQNKNNIREIGYKQVKHNESAGDSGVWRPFIVWFGEEVPMLNVAAELVQQADFLMVIGTSLQVYPAASLVYYTKAGCKLFLVEPNDMDEISVPFTHIKEKAGTGVPTLVENLIDEVKLNS
jgi:NAD-dependent deacetylase